MKKILKNINHTVSQINSIAKYHDFIEGDSSVLIIKGYAGTGKTTLIDYICKDLNKNRINSNVMAPTGRAAKVVSDKIDNESFTIHKSIYALDNLIEFDSSNQSSNSFKYFFGLKYNVDSSKSVYIVDESSMISNNFSDSLFFRFGSGYLLNDLIKYTQVQNNKYNRKIIFVGDTAQLPPIGMDYSPALDANYLRSIYNIKVDETELIDVVRQKSDSGILENATRIRKQITSHRLEQFNIDNSYSDIKKIDYNDIVKEYMSLRKNSSPIIIAHSNKTVHEYNSAIRNKLYPKSINIEKGDKVLVIRNNYKYGLLNGEFGTIVGICSETEHKKIHLKNEGGVNVDLYFKDLLINVNTIDGKSTNIKCKVIKNILDSKNSFLTRNEQQALYVLYIINMKSKGIKPKTPEFREGIKNDPYFNALCIKYGYAVTCHKAQGGEWDNVIVDFNASLNKLSDKYFRSCYTALTRCSKNLLALNKSHNDIIFDIDNVMRDISK